MTRLCSDAYNKGVVRSAQERANLNANKKDNDVLAAETVRTAQTEGMPGRDLVTWREHLTSGGGKTELRDAVGVDRRNPQKWTAVMKNLAFLYGHRPAHDDVWFLSPYEFVCYWEVVLARYSLSEEENDEYEYHAELTPRGRAKLSKRCGADLIPGVDYQVKESGGCGWLPFPGDDKEVENIATPGSCSGGDARKIQVS